MLRENVMTLGFPRVDELGWKDDERGRDSSFIQFSFSSLNITLILLPFDSLSHPHHSSPTLIHLSSCLILFFFIPPLRSFSFPPISLSLFIHSNSIFLCQVPSPIGFLDSSNVISFLKESGSQTFQVVDSFNRDCRPL